MKIIIYPSFFEVVYDNFYQRTELRKMLTIDVPGARYTHLFKSKKWDGKKCFMGWKNGVIPNGMVPIGFLSRAMKLFNLNDKDLDDRRRINSIKFEMPTLIGLKLRDYQKEAIFSGFENKNCLIQAATNAGKSAIISGLCKILKDEKVLILIHRKEILVQLREMVMDQTGMNVGTVTSDYCDIDPKINIAMILTLVNRLDTDDEITEMFDSSNAVMIDEAHHGQSESFQKVLRRSKATYRYGFSGTIQEESSYDGWQTRMYIGDVVFNISNKELIEQGISAEPSIFVHRITHHINYAALVEEVKARFIKEGKLQKDEEPDWRMRQELYKPVYQMVIRSNIINNKERNGIVVQEVCGEYKDKQCLIVIDYLDHGRILYDLLWEKEKNNVAFIHGDSETREGSLDRFRNGKLRVLISTNIIDEGIDINRIQMLFLVGGKKSRRQILQRIGRGLRKKDGENVVHILDFYDSDGKYLEKHSRERLKIYKKEGFSIEVI